MNMPRAFCILFLILFHELLAFGQGYQPDSVRNQDLGWGNGLNGSGQNGPQIGIPPHNPFPNTPETPDDPHSDYQVLVLMLNFPNQPNEPFTVEQINEVFFSPSTASLNTLIEENSYGRLSVVGMTADWITLSQNSSFYCSNNFPGANFRNLGIPEALSIAEQGYGIDLSLYQGLVALVPEGTGCGCCGSGSALGLVNYTNQAGENLQFESVFRSGNTSSGGVVKIYQVVAHEFGHAWGLGHGNALDCGADVIRPNNTGCSTIEYGNPFDGMSGAFHGHFSAPHKWQMGWIDDAHMVTVDAPGEYGFLLDPLQTVDGIKTIRILRNIEGSGIPNWFFLENRQAIGFESYLSQQSQAQNVDQGILINYAREFSPGRVSPSPKLIDMTPNPSNTTVTDYFSATLLREDLFPNNGFLDPQTGIQIHVVEFFGYAAGVIVVVP